MLDIFQAQFRSNLLARLSADNFESSIPGKEKPDLTKQSHCVLKFFKIDHIQHNKCTVHIAFSKLIIFKIMSSLCS